MLGSLSWATLIALSHEYRVSSALALAVETSSPSDVPAGVDVLLSSLASHMRRRNERIYKEAIEVAGILNGIGVTPVFMKGGAHLLAGLYPDIAIRQLADLDILVPATRLDDCVAALNERRIEGLTAYLHPRSHHCQPLGRSDLPVPIELHHEVLAYPSSSFLTSEEMQSSAGRLTIRGVHVGVPSPTHAVMHCIAHAQLNDHDHLYGRVDLRGLLDLALLSYHHRNAIDWIQVSRRFSHAGYRLAFGYHVLWARRLGAEVPAVGRINGFSKLLYRRATFHMRRPKMLSLSVRLIRPLVLLRRELSDQGLRRRLVGNLLNVDWWKRHLRMLTES